MSDAKHIPKAGDVLAGKYEVEHVLGQGGMGVVVAARHKQLDQRVALKFLLPEAMAHAQVVERFAREARAAARIKGEHVARVIDVGEMEGGIPYMVLEYLEGRDLGAALAADGPLPVGDAVRYVLETCEALAEAHAAGIVHRDLKPANLFIAKHPGQRDIVKVLDFGISKMIEPANQALTQTATVLGTAFYMSPEQL
ncbi:MAG: serine/threonine protein kinase, partial [Myxococcales bacterium]|nr:serine/threonine protein kinase [Myxococcales bacterium]